MSSQAFGFRRALLGSKLLSTLSHYATALSKLQQNASPLCGTLQRGFTSLPAHMLMTMPSLSPTMERGNIVSWKVAQGNAIKPGDVLAEIETDKATLAFENVSDEGFIARILVPAGSRDVPVGTPVAIVVEHEHEVPAFADGASNRSSTAAVPSFNQGRAAVSGATAQQQQLQDHVQAKFRMGPAVRILLESLGLSPADVTPTGPRCVITKADVHTALGMVLAGRSTSAAPAAVNAPQPTTKQVTASVRHTSAAPPTEQSAPAPPAQMAAPARKDVAMSTGQLPYADIPNSQIRRIIAKRLMESKVAIPAIYLTADVHLNEVKGLRASLATQKIEVSMNEFVLRAVALSLRDVPSANVAWNASTGNVVRFNSIDVSFAVATDKGLITPVIKAADSKGLLVLREEVRSLAVRARKNMLKPEEFTGGSFTVSNLGMYGVSYFSAIINPPQAGILAIGGARESAVLRGGEPAITTTMTVTLSADARVYDAELAGELLAAFQGHMENPFGLIDG